MGTTLCKMQCRKNNRWDCCLIVLPASFLILLKRGCTDDHWSGEANVTFSRMFWLAMGGETWGSGDRGGGVSKNLGLFLLSVKRVESIWGGESGGGC